MGLAQQASVLAIRQSQEALAPWLENLITQSTAQVSQKIINVSMEVCISSINLQGLEEEMKLTSY